MQEAKSLVLSFYRAIDKSPPEEILAGMKKHCSPTYTWRGAYPFCELGSAEEVCEHLWKPLRQSLQPIQRRQDVLMVGPNSLSSDRTVWVVSMGHLMGNFDRPYLNIPHTGKMAFVRYCEFTQVQNGQIIHSAMWFDIPQLMMQAGVNPFPPQTGAHVIQPGPMTHQGYMEGEQDPAESKKTLDTINAMMNNLGNWDSHLSLEEELALNWHQDMIWWGPNGIGSSYTIERYAKQHSGPFRATLTDRKWNGHICRLAEGHFGGFFGWPNLTLTSTGGFMGMPGSNKPHDMRVIDIYRREDNKLAENWVFIDMLYYWKQQGLDILERMESLRPREL